MSYCNALKNKKSYYSNINSGLRLPKNYGGLSLTGFTLIEFVVAASIFLIISLILVLVINYTVNSIEMFNVSSSLQEEMQNAINIITAELRQTRSAKISVGPLNADGIWYNSITFAIPFDIDADADILDASGAIEWSSQNPANWSINYSLSGGQLIRTAGDGRNPVLANHIISLAFRRLSSTPMLIEISLTARRNTFLNRQIELQLTSGAKMRN